MEIRLCALVGLLLAAVGCAKADAANTVGGTGGLGQTSMGTGGSGATSTSGGTTGGSTASGGGGFSPVSCNKASTTTTTITFTTGATPTSSTSTTTTYYADIPVAGLDPASPPPIRAVYCTADLSTVGTPPATGYTVTTTHSGDPDPGASCYQTFPSFAAGHVYVTCGSATADSMGTVTSSNRYSKVYVSM